MLRPERRLGRNGLRGVTVTTEALRGRTRPAAGVAVPGTAGTAREAMAEASGRNPDDFQWEGLAAQGRPAGTTAGPAGGAAAIDAHEDI